MAHAALLAEQNGRHIDLVGTLLRNEDRRMAVGAGQPLRMLTMREYHIGHRGLYRTHNVEIHDEGFFVRIDAIPARRQFLFVDSLHPIDLIAEFGGGQNKKNNLWRRGGGRAGGGGGGGAGGRRRRGGGGGGRGGAGEG